jgi:hypothetical protein
MPRDKEGKMANGKGTEATMGNASLSSRRSLGSRSPLSTFCLPKHIPSSLPASPKEKHLPPSPPPSVFGPWTLDFGPWPFGLRPLASGLSNSLSRKRQKIIPIYSNLFREGAASRVGRETPHAEICAPLDPETRPSSLPAPTLNTRHPALAPCLIRLRHAQAFAQPKRRGLSGAHS